MEPENNELDLKTDEAISAESEARRLQLARANDWPLRICFFVGMMTSLPACGSNC
ncbi:expressed protein [Arabidopsis lyrata subsp. lyrata]|uniref:Expressed protein n=2 Tax=Arabidopsis lyrata subsp. lyrata TaxID=81972 RepID=D7KKQ5_ARALL|nr:expressed protein [Arabidopsis lyrata subsp. lyrata]